MSYVALGFAVVLGGVSAVFAQEMIGEVVSPTLPAAGQASLRPIEEEAAAAAPALPPDLSLMPEPDGMEFEVVDEGAPTAATPGARDPFRPFTLDFQPKLVAEDEFLTPLQRYDLQQLKVVGVLLDLEPPRAMLQDDAGMGYIVTPGTLIGRQHGVVTDVQPRRVIVEETYVDFYGREQVRKAVLEMLAGEVVAGKSGTKK